MGQRQGVSGYGAGDLRYSAYTSSELRLLAGERGLAKQCRRRGGLLEADRVTLIALLKAYDAGVSAAWAGGSDKVTSNFEAGPYEETSAGYWYEGLRQVDADLEVVQKILNAPGPKGVDIGGTLWKVVLAIPGTLDTGCRDLDSTSMVRRDLDFQCELDGGSYNLRFASGATGLIEAAITDIQNHAQLELPYLPQDDNSSESETISTRESSRADFKELPSPSSSNPLCDSRSPSDNSLVSMDGDCIVSHPMQKVFTAGGGAHKFAHLFREALRVEVVAVKELAAVVDGLIFLMLHGPRAGSLFLANDGADESVALPWPEPLFPFMVVNMGSGVSILQVNSAEENDYVRVGGTACGGGTFLGLARALTSAETFEDALRLAEGGDASKCDLLVRDIYGDEGCASLGLPGAMTASNFGKLCEAPTSDEDDHGKVCSEQDLARSLLQMVTQQSVLLASTLARHAGCMDRVFFMGGFVERENHIARKVIASNFERHGRAYFLRHSDYLGALGSLWSCLRAGGKAV
jgi:pantothenate kinase